MVVLPVQAQVVAELLLRTSRKKDDIGYNHSYLLLFLSFNIPFFTNINIIPSGIDKG